MATKTAGTNSTTNMTALQFPSFSAAAMADADIATIAQAIINDEDPPMIQPGAFSRMGLLYVPNRGVLKCRKGDWVMVGPDGWPILVSSMAAPTTLAVNGTPVNLANQMVMASSVRVAGWQLGSLINGTGITAGTTITNISADGLTVTMSAAATSSPGATAITNGSYTHS
jgi:hypothetical protein